MGFDDRDLTLLRGEIERGLALGAEPLRVGPEFDQLARESDVPAHRSEVQEREALVVSQGEVRGREVFVSLRGVHLREFFEGARRFVGGW